MSPVLNAVVAVAVIGGAAFLGHSPGTTPTVSPPEPAAVPVTAGWEPPPGVPAGWFQCWDTPDGHGGWVTVIGPQGGVLLASSVCPVGTATRREQDSWDPRTRDYVARCVAAQHATRPDLHPERWGGCDSVPGNERHP